MKAETGSVTSRGGYWRQASVVKRIAYLATSIVAVGGALVVMSGWLDPPGRAYIAYAVEREYRLTDTLRSYDARIDSVTATVMGMRAQVDTLAALQGRMLAGQENMMLLLVLQSGNYTETEKRRLLMRLRTRQITLDSLMQEIFLR